MDEEDALLSGLDEEGALSTSPATFLHAPDYEEVSHAVALPLNAFAVEVAGLRLDTGAADREATFPDAPEASSAQVMVLPFEAAVLSSAGLIGSTEDEQGALGAATSTSQALLRWKRLFVLAA